MEKQIISNRLLSVNNSFIVYYLLVLMKENAQWNITICRTTDKL